MRSREVITKGGLAFAIFLAVLMMMSAFIWLPPLYVEGHRGLCFPSPDGWNLSQPFSWILNLFVTLTSAATLFFINRKYNFLKSTDNTLPAALLILIAANPLISTGFNASTLLLMANAVILSVLFGTYKTRNATQQYFLIATIIGLGAMTEYAFLPMIAVVIIGGIRMKSIHLKEIMAFGMGLIAPFWVGIGLGILNPMDFTLPQLSNLFDDLGRNSDLFVMLISVALTILLSISLSLHNSLSLYAGNPKVRAINSVINTMGYVCVISICIDFTNMLAYLGSLYLWTAVELANLFALNKGTASRGILWILTLIYLGLYIWMLF